MAAPQAVARTDETPEWLLVMRAMTGLVETPGDADNPKILAMADEIARTYPEMEAYCAQYNHDSIAWCGLATAYCMTMAGIRPVFGPTDTDKFLWAQAWDDSSFGTKLDQPVLGCVVVMTRSGGGHVTLYEGDAGSNIKCRGGNQSDSINVSNYAKSSVIAYVWPNAAIDDLPPQPRRELKKGDTGADVAALQTSLGIPADGDFGAVTDSQVRAFQASCGLGIDGEVGPNTWAQVDALDARMLAGNSGLTKELTDAIVALAKGSPLMNYSWPDRGKAPAGYIPGMALSYAIAMSMLEQDNSAAQLMAQADTNNTDKDALAWYADQFEDHEMDNSQDGIDTLRHLFVLLTGLGMRESSGKYCEGRDMSASNVSADTAEAGLFQTSWNIRSASAEMQNIFNAYWNDPNGFLPQFCVGISPSSSNLQVFGTGAGASYQWLAKFSPAFAAMTTAVGLRTRRNHWGPINRYEVDLNDAVDDLLIGVQALVDAGPPPEPEPEPVPEPGIATITITIDPPGSARVVITGNAPV